MRGLVARGGIAVSCLFLFLLPITHTTPLRLVCLALTLVAALLALARRVRVPPLPRTLAIAIAAWVVLCLLASIFSVEPEYSWGEFRNEVIVPLVAFASFYVLAHDRSVARTWRLALFASFVVASSIAITSYLLYGDWLRSSFVGDRNAYSTYLVLIVPFILFWWSESTPHPIARRAAVAAALLVVMASAVFTQNRNMWFGFLAECIVWAGLVYLRAPAEVRRRMRSTYIVVGVVGALVFVAALTLVIRDKARVSNTTIESRMRVDQDPRLAIWAYAADRIAERPFTGHGYGRGILRKDFREHFGDPLKWHGHNALINYTIEAGIVGGLVLIALWLAWWRQAWRCYRSRDPFIAKQGIWMMAMFTGILVKMVTDDILIRENALLFWSLLGIACGLCLRRDEPLLDSAAA